MQQQRAQNGAMSASLYKASSKLESCNQQDQDNFAQRHTTAASPIWSQGPMYAYTYIYINAHKYVHFCLHFCVSMLTPCCMRRLGWKHHGLNPQGEVYIHMCLHLYPSMLTPFFACHVLGWTQRGLSPRGGDGLQLKITRLALRSADARNNSSQLPLGFVIKTFCSVKFARPNFLYFLSCGGGTRNQTRAPFQFHHPNLLPLQHCNYVFPKCAQTNVRTFSS